jgi:hypothetical protein
MQELAQHLPHFRRGLLNVNAYPKKRADEGRGMVTAMGYGEMVGLIVEIGPAGIGDADELVGEIGIEFLQQPTSGQVLQPLVGVRDLPLQGHPIEEEGFLFRDAPQTQATDFVYILLIKQGHDAGANIRISGLNSNVGKV